MKVKCLIVDDEPLARSLIRNHLEKLENFEIAAECSDAMKALQVLRQHQVDLMFIDIKMPQINGIDFLKILKNPPGVIFTTAHQEYAIDGFELDVVDFLLKPIAFERFLKAIDKFYQLYNVPRKVVDSEAREQQNRFIYVKENKKAVKLSIDEIIYVEGLSEYVQIYTEDRKLITKLTLSGLEEMLASDNFLRIHKSYIISIKHIKAYTSTSIDMPGKTLPIGRSYKQSVHRALQSGINFIT